jgi:uncharacterized membrane protein YjfL (UPF0719 family)
MDRLLNIEDVYALNAPQEVFYLLLTLAMLFVARCIYDLTTSYSLSSELTKKDNGAVALAFGGYLFGVTLILWTMIASSSTATESAGYWQALGWDMFMTAAWGAIGIVFLQIARVANDKLLLYRFDNTKELVEDRNIGTGAIECGGYIGSAMMVAAALSGDGSAGFGTELLLSAIYFAAGQAAFILFAFVYDLATAYKLHDEIERDNAAAGVSFGMTLVAVGIVLSAYVKTYDSLIGLAVWFVLSTIVLIALRFFVDRLILPGDKLDTEISRDRNWGAALIEGSVAVGIAVIMASAL